LTDLNEYTLVSIITCSLSLSFGLGLKIQVIEPRSVRVFPTTMHKLDCSLYFDLFYEYYKLGSRVQTSDIIGDSRILRADLFIEVLLFRMTEFLELIR